MADTQKNPGGVPYSVRYKGEFSHIPDGGSNDGQQQQCDSILDAWRAVSAIKPNSEPGSVASAQSVHDPLAFILRRLGDMFVRHGVLYFPARCISSGYEFGTSGYSNQDLKHYHWAIAESSGKGVSSYPTGAPSSLDTESLGLDDNRKEPYSRFNGPAREHPAFPSSLVKNMTNHDHNVDMGGASNLTPLFFQSISPSFPFNCFTRHKTSSKNLDVQFHVPQDSIATILGGATTPSAVAIAISAAISNSQFWCYTGTLYGLPTFGYTGYGNSALVSDRFDAGSMYNWGATYEKHLCFWLYRAYYSGIVDKPDKSDAKSTLTYSINPFGITYWPGSKEVLEDTVDDLDLMKICNRWLGQDPDFPGFDEWIANELWPGLSSSVQMSNYQEYIAELDRFASDKDEKPADITKFSEDPRVDNNGCRTPLFIGYTITYTGQ